MPPSALFRQDVSYTDAERLIMDFIAHSPTEFLVMSIQQVSGRLGVSDATVSRFARHAGFRDFKELKASVASATLGPAEKIRASMERTGGERAFLEAQRDHLAHTLELLDEGAFERAADALAASPRVMLMAKGAAAAVAELLRVRLARFGKEVIALAPGSDMAEGLVRADAETTLVAFGFERIPAEVELALEHVREVDATSVLVTGRHLGSSGALADVELVAWRGEPRGYHSMTSAVALIDALVVAVASRMDGEALERLERLRALKRANEDRLPR